MYATTVAIDGQLGNRTGVTSIDHPNKLLAPRIPAAVWIILYWPGPCRMGKYCMDTVAPEGLLQGVLGGVPLRYIECN